MAVLEMTIAAMGCLNARCVLLLCSDGNTGVLSCFRHQLQLLALLPDVHDVHIELYGTDYVGLSSRALSLAHFSGSGRLIIRALD